MKAQKKDTQYTIRNIPVNIDRALRDRATSSGKSLNEVTLEALASGVGETAKPKRDLTYMIGTMSAKEASQLQHEISNQRKIDADLWK
jgi:plasmid stability protein